MRLVLIELVLQAFIFFHIRSLFVFIFYILNVSFFFFFFRFFMRRMVNSAILSNAKTLRVSYSS